MNRKEIMKELRNLERGCMACNKVPKKVRSDSKSTWCKKNCPVIKQFEALGAELAVNMEQRKADRAVAKYRQENEMGPGAGTPNPNQRAWKKLLASV